MTRGWIVLGIAIVGALLGAARVLDAPPQHGPRPAQASAAESAPVVVGGIHDYQHGPDAPPHRREPAGRHRLLRPAPTAAQHMAATFLGAYLAFEVGRARFDQLRALRRTSTPRLWSQLNAGRGEPQPPTTLSEARLTQLVPGVTASGRAVALLATLRRGSTRSPLALVMRRAGGQWRVAAIGR